MNRIASVINIAYLLVIMKVCTDEDLPNVSLETLTNNKDDFVNMSGPTTENMDFEWLPEAVKDIAYYLRQYKFNEYDRRYSKSPSEGIYFSEFPRPPLRSLHWEVQIHCEVSFIHCMEYLYKKVKSTGLRRKDDTSIVIMEQNWNESNTEQIKTVDLECQKFKDNDFKLANPFQGPLERFKWRTTASYYLCWYTMNEVPTLEHLREPCDNFAYCLDPNYGPQNRDIRANDHLSYYCALYSFCPDPCCPIRHISNYSECYNSELNPCLHNSNDQRICEVRRSENTDFSSIVLNRWNVSCECSEGFAWMSRFGLCVDVNECSVGTHTCNDVSEICVNIQGDFLCVCNWGFVWEELEEKCIESAAVKVIKGKFKEKQGEKKRFKFSFKELFKKVFISTADESNFNVYIIVVMIFILYLI